MARYRARYWDPEGEIYGIPTYPWKHAPEGLATQNQLRADGLRKRGQPVAAVRWPGRGGDRVAWLYRRADACPPAPRSPAQVASLAAAHRTLRTCPSCGTERPYRISTRYRACADCLGLAA